jgi:N-acyl amino acid synthase FeeM
MKSSAEPSTSFVRGAGLFDRVDYRLIESPEERDTVYLMRYRAYLQGGLISPSGSHRIIDQYDESPNAWLFGIYIDGELCSSIRIHVLTSEWRMSYSTELFGDVLHPRLDRGEVFVDPARFSADPEKSQRFPELPYLTVRLGYLACDHFNAHTGLAMVRTDHQAFYRRVFLSETLTDARAFPGWHSRKVVLTASDFRTVREKILARFPIMRSSAFERRMLFDRASQRKAAPRPTLISAPLNPDTAALPGPAAVVSIR